MGFGINLRTSFEEQRQTNGSRKNSNINDNSGSANNLPQSAAANKEVESQQAWAKGTARQNESSNQGKKKPHHVPNQHPRK